MTKQIFINLVVSDLIRSEKFYTALGFVKNPQFSDDTAKCMVWSDSIFLMIMTADKFNNFATKPIADTKSNLAALFSLSFPTIEDVNQAMTAGLSAGGIEPAEMKDYGFMVQRSIEDFDGHTWELFFMDMSKFPVQA